jgi:hypothetical protein
MATPDWFEVAWAWTIRELLHKANNAIPLMSGADQLGAVLPGKLYTRGSRVIDLAGQLLARWVLV